MRTIAHISDLHFGRVDPRIAEALRADLRQQKFDLLVCSGDFTQRARVGQYRQSAAFMKELRGPQLTIPGNHDIPLWNILRRFFSPLGRYRKFINSNFWPTYSDSEIFVVGMNTSRPFTFSFNGFWKDGKISASQLDHLRQLFSHAPARSMKILVTHHPFIPPQGPAVHHIVHGARRALAELENLGVDILLAGHLHMGYLGDIRTHHESIKRSILSIQAGTAISTRRRNEPNAYNLISIEPNCVRVEARVFVGDHFQTGTVRQFRRIEDLWIEGKNQSPTGCI